MKITFSKWSRFAVTEN